jgi:hypothetical protein
VNLFTREQGKFIHLKNRYSKYSVTEGDGTVTEEYSTCDGYVTERIFENILTLI